MSLRQLLLTAILFTANLIYSQDLTYLGNGQLKFEKIIEFPGLTANDEYSKSLKWFVENYKNSEEVITGKVENELIKGTAISQGIIVVDAFVTTDLKYSLKLDFQDNKVRFQIFDFIYNPTGIKMTAITHDSNGKLKNSKKAIRIMGNMEDHCKSLLSNYTQYLQKTDTW